MHPLCYFIILCTTTSKKINTVPSVKNIMTFIDRTYKDMNYLLFRLYKDQARTQKIISRGGGHNKIAIKNIIIQ